MHRGMHVCMLKFPAHVLVVASLSKHFAPPVWLQNEFIENQNGSGVLCGIFQEENLYSNDQ